MKDLNLFRTKDSVYLREVKSKAEVLEDLNCPQWDNSSESGGFLIRGSEKVARSIIASLRDKKFTGKIGIYGGDDAFNRRVIESLKVDYLVSAEALTGRDNLKQRDSGLNHVVAKIAAKKSVGIVVDMGEISRLGGVEKAERIAKIMQNIKVCRKVGCKVLIASLAGDKR